MKWSNWASLGGSFLVANPVTYLTWPALEVFILGPNGDLQLIRQTGNGPDGWTGATWDSLGGRLVSTPGVMNREVFAVGVNGDLQHIWQR
jgi:hypothetical protein